MTPGDRMRLEHMRQYALKATTLVGQDDAAELEADENRLLALVAALIILGEAAAQLSEDRRRQLPDLPWQDAKRLRNMLVHRYFEIRASDLVDTVRHDLPPLIAEIDRILAEEPTP